MPGTLEEEYFQSASQPRRLDTINRVRRLIAERDNHVERFNQNRVFLKLGKEGF